MGSGGRRGVVGLRYSYHLCVSASKNRMHGVRERVDGARSTPSG